MAIIKAISSHAGINQAIDYVIKEEKTDMHLISGVNCNPDTAADEMQATKYLWGKDGGRTYKHFMHSYPAGDDITPEQVHKNTLELVNGTAAFKGFEVLVATHKDKEHYHSHVIVNSVNYQNGYKLQWSKTDLVDLKERCNEQSRQQGLSVPEKGKTWDGQDREETTAWTKEKYQLLKNAEAGDVKSHVQDIALATLECKETATSREDFINRMEQKGYAVDWQDKHKNITFTDLARQQAGEQKCKVRNSKLDQYYNLGLGKDELQHEFETNIQQAGAEREAREQLDAIAAGASFFQ